MVSWGKGPHPPVPGPPTSLLFDLLHPVSHEAQFLFYFRTLFTVDSFSCPFSPFSTIFLNNRLIPILLCLKLLSCKISHLYIREKGVVPGTIFQHFKNSSRGLIIFIALDVYFKYCQWAGSAQVTPLFYRSSNVSLNFSDPGTVCGEYSLFKSEKRENFKSAQDSFHIANYLLKHQRQKTGSPKAVSTAGKNQGSPTLEGLPGNSYHA